MAYLSPEFRHDIFFSYPHADVDRTGDSELKAWSQQFAEDLRRQLLTSKKHADLSFFLDQGARADERLDEAATPSRALDEARNAAILIALMSPWYLASRWCREERETWIEGISGDPGRIAQELDRAFVMRVQETEDPWPPEFSDGDDDQNLGFWLYDREDPIGPFGSIGSIGDDLDKGQYRRALARVKQRLWQRLDQLHARLKEAREQRRDVRSLFGEEEEPTPVYVHARPSAKDAFEETCAQLINTHFFPINTQPEPLPRDGRLSDTEMEQLLDANALLVLGTDEGELARDMFVVGRTARQLATSKTPKRLPGAALDRSGVPDAHAALLPRARMVGLELLDGADPTWTTALREHLRRAAAEALETAA